MQTRGKPLHYKTVRPTLPRFLSAGLATLGLGLAALVFTPQAHASPQKHAAFKVPVLRECNQWLLKETRSTRTWLDIEEFKGDTRTTRVIRLKTEPVYNLRGAPQTAREKDLLKWVMPSVKFANQAYANRRRWPPSFRKKLLDIAKRYLANSVYVQVYDNETRELLGSVRFIRAPYMVKNGEKIPDQRSENPLGSTPSSSPLHSSPPETLPVNEYLDIEFEPVAPEGKAGVDVEAGTFTIDETLPQATRSEIWSELWLQLNRLTFDGGGALLPKDIPDLVYTYADQFSLRLYEPLGFEKLRRYFMRAADQTSKLVEYPVGTEPAPIVKDGLKWWPVVFRPERMLLTNAKVTDQKLANLPLSARRTEIAGGFGRGFAMTDSPTALIVRVKGANRAESELAAIGIIRAFEMAQNAPESEKSAYETYLRPVSDTFQELAGGRFANDPNAKQGLARLMTRFIGLKVPVMSLSTTSLVAAIATLLNDSEPEIKKTALSVTHRYLQSYAELSSETEIEAAIASLLPRFQTRMKLLNYIRGSFFDAQAQALLRDEDPTPFLEASGKLTPEEWSALLLVARAELRGVTP